MAIRVSWYNDNRTALLYRFPQEWTWDTFYAVKAEADRLLDAVDYPVVLIFDMTETCAIPSGALFQARTLISRAHPRGKPIMLVSTNAVVEAMYNLVSRLHVGIHDWIKLVATFDEACGHLDNDDAQAAM